MRGCVGMNDMMNVLWFINIPSPYRVDFFEELGKRMDLTVVFEKKNSDERDKSWTQERFHNFEGIILSGKSVWTDSAIDFRVIQYLKRAKYYSHVIISNPLTPLGMFCIQYLHSHHIKFYIETDGGFPKAGFGLKEKLKKLMIGRATGWLSTAEIHDQYYLQYGAIKDCIYRYPFTSIRENDILTEPLSEVEKTEIRHSLGINETKMVLFVGQFIYRKGVDVLLQIAEKLQDTAFVLLGGTETDEYRQIREKNDLKNIYYPGFIHRNKIKEYYCAADIFVLPTREDIWGLVINEAMAFGLPIITTNRCIAGTALIKNEKNGFIISVDDADKLYEYVSTLLSNTKLRKEIAIRNLELSWNYTIEEMARWHDEFFAREIFKT